MLVALTAVLVAAFYAANVPLKVAFCARVGGGMGASLSVRAFEGRFALRAAKRRLNEGKGPSKPKPERRALGTIWRTVRRLLRHIRLEYLSVSLVLGLADAAGTAIAVGCVNALLQAARASTGARVVCEVRPDFRDPHFEGEVSGIISLTAGHIILAALLGTIESSGRN
ncbi:MAG: DUF2953 domain-containing protein [Clostridiales bacterium]|nr:DUF2953 domain-containing protein [Clostridiales bacterium]